MKSVIYAIFVSLALLFGQTSEQIKQAKGFIKKSNMSKSQAIEAARAQGYSDKKIESIIQSDKNSKSASVKFEEKNQLPELGSSNEVLQDPSIPEKVDNSYDEEIQLIEDELEIVDEVELNIESKAEPLKAKLAYFGYDIFARDPALFQSTSFGIVDPDYLIGPGDEIIVMLWGETQFRQVLTVDREGFVFIPEIGQVFVNGLNLNLLESKLFRVFSQSYASLNPSGRSPTTFLDISLGNLRPLRIQVLGEVAQPGAYTVSPSATLFSALYYFNGPTTSGSLRDIQLIRGGKKIASIDFYDFLLTGKKPKDQKLQVDDVIFIPRRLKTVASQGDVNRPGVYELKPDETLSDLISISGDLMVTAYLDRGQIDRIVPFQDRDKLGMDRIYTDFNLRQVIESKAGFKILDNDKVTIFSILDQRQNIVTIGGAVTRPGTYDIGESLKISELIQKADGLNGDAYLDRVDIIRTRSDFSQELIKLDLEKVIAGNADEDIYLQSLDKVQIYGMTEMVPKKFVSISGHIKNPGVYPMQEKMTLYDLTFLAGGFVDNDFKNLTYLKRAELIRNSKDGIDKEIIPFDLGKVIEKQGMANILLQNDDLIKIYSLKEIEGDTRFVTISGHVKRPGRYELFEKNMKMHDIIFRAGGFDDPLFRSQTFLERADLIRFDKDQINKKIITFSLNDILNSPENESNLYLNPGDEIRIYPLNFFNIVRPVTIDGAIKNPGVYELKLGMNVKDLILEAGGVSENVYRYKLEVARIDPLKEDERVFSEIIKLNMDNDYSVSMQNFVPKNSSDVIKENGFLLMPYDILSVRPDPHFQLQDKVLIKGEVLYPGTYVIRGPDETLADIVDRAGGLRKNSFAIGSRFSRNGQTVQIDIKNIIKNKRSKANINVQDGDEIYIASKPNIIQIIGEVNSPGFFKFVGTQRLTSAIKQAGGLNPEANKEDIHIRYPNGKSAKYKPWFRNPKVIDGSTIIVGRKPEEEPFDSTEYAKELTAILANLAQTITVVLVALRN